MGLAFFAVGVISAWAIGVLSRGGISQNPPDQSVAELCRLLELSLGLPLEW